MTLIPIDDNVFVTRCDAIEAEGVVHIPKQYQDRPNEGIVQAIGPNCQINPETDAPLLHVGDRIMWASHAGDTVEHNGTEYVQVEEPHILAIFGDEDE